MHPREEDDGSCQISGVRSLGWELIMVLIYFCLNRFHRLQLSAGKLDALVVFANCTSFFFFTQALPTKAIVIPFENWN